MDSSIKIVDNFLDNNTFWALESFFMSTDMQWNYNPGTVKDVDPNNLTDFQFVRTLYDNGPSRDMNVIYQIFDKLDVRIPMRVKLNLNTVTPEIIKRDFHIDQSNCNDIPCKTAILYMNTNNGYTLMADEGVNIKAVQTLDTVEFKTDNNEDVFRDQNKSMSIRNKCTIHDGSRPHCSSTCTDEKIRILIAINYF